MPTYRVYYDAVIHYSADMEIEAETAEDAQTRAYTTPIDVGNVTPEHVTTFNVSAVSWEDAHGNECFEDEDDAGQPSTSAGDRA